MSDYQAQVDELMAEYRRSRDQLAEVHQQLGAIRETVTSPDRTVTATVGPHGGLVDLTLSEDAYRRHAPAALANLVVQTTADAAGRAAGRAEQALAPVLPADADPAAVLAGRADLSEAEVAPPESAVPAGPRPASRRREDVDDGFEDHSWLQSDPIGRSR